MASHNTQAGIKAVQTSQASVNYVNNVVTGWAPNTYSPYDSHGNVYSYYNSSYDTGKIPSPDAPRIKDVDAGNLEYCEKGKEKKSNQFLNFTQNAWEKLKQVDWGRVGMEALSVAEIVGGIALICTGAGAPAGVTLLGVSVSGTVLVGAGSVAISAGIASEAGGIISEMFGGSFKSGWGGGQVGGLITGFGLAVGTMLGFPAIAAEAAAIIGGGIGGGVGNVVSQKLETGEVNWSEALEAGKVTAIVSGFAGVVGNVPTRILLSTGAGIAEKVTGSIITIINEIIADTSSSIIPEGGG